MKPTIFFAMHRSSYLSPPFNLLNVNSSGTETLFFIDLIGELTTPFVYFVKTISLVDKPNGWSIFGLLIIGAPSLTNSIV